MKAQGVRAGVSDLILFYPCFVYHGLALEFKREDETWSAVTEDQIEFLERAQSDGYAAAVAFGMGHGQDIIERYLSEKTVCLLDSIDFLKRRKTEKRARK